MIYLNTLENAMHMNQTFAVAVLLAATALSAQEKESKRKGPGPEDLPTSSLISRAGPSFRVPQTEVGEHTKVIAYGDQ